MPNGGGGKTVNFTDAGCAAEQLTVSTPSGIRKSDFDYIGTQPILGDQAAGEVAHISWPAAVGSFTGLATTIPGLLGLGGPEPLAVPGNGWEVTVSSHTDFSTRLAQVNPATAQFAKILNDKGSGTVVLNRDDKFLFPDAPVSFNANPDFPGGSLAGWNADTGGGGVSTLNPSQTQLWQYPWSLRVTPTSSPFAAYGVENAVSDQFPVLPGEVYQVSAMGYADSSWVTYTGPPPPGVTVPVGGIQMPCFAIGMYWYDPNRALISRTMVATQPGTYLTQGTWTPLSSGPVVAPPGAVYGAVAIGVSNNPPNASHHYFQHVIATTDGGCVTLGDMILEHENLWQFWWQGKRCFEFLGQTITEQIDDASEQRNATVTGPGSIDTLRWAAAMPPGFPTIVFKTDSLQDGFAEVDANGNPALDLNIWNQSAPLDHITLSPLGTCQITASTGGTVLGAQPYDLTGSSVSFQITPITGSGLDGSQVTQFYIADLADPIHKYALIGLAGATFYAKFSTGASVANASGTKQLGGYDPNGDAYWRIGDHQGKFRFWTSADGNSWTLNWEVAHPGWTPSYIGVYVSATYDVDLAQFATVTNLNGDIITPSSAGNIFLLTPIMSVWYQLFQQAQSRGTIPFVTTRLNNNHDSYGNGWTDGMSVQVANGTDLYSLLQGYAGIINADWLMQPGFELRVGLPGGGPKGTGIGLGRDLTKQVVIYESAQIITRQRVRARDQVANLIGGVNSDGTVVTDSDAASINEWWQRELWVQTAQEVNTESMAIVTAASLDQVKDEILTWTLTVRPDAPGATVFTDYDVGDWIGVERPAQATSIIDAFRVVGIAINIDASATQITVELTLNSYRQWLQEQFQYLVNKFGGSFINTIGTTPVTSTSSGPTSLPTVVTPSLGGLGNVNLG